LGLGIWVLGFGLWDLGFGILTALLQHVRRTIRRHDLCPSGTSVLVALSGGSDSVALAFVLRELAPNGGFALAGVAHFNHRLRPTAARDEQFCRSLADRLGLPIVVGAVDVRTYAASERLSIEDAARRARYAFLHRAAADMGADRIAVGHTRDDQAETFLLKLVRGAGLAGLGGIYPRRNALIRPLLDVSRADLRRHLEALGECWVEDESNVELDNPRNRIRHRVIPELDAAYMGPTSASIARAAALAREDGAWLDETAERRYLELAEEGAEGVSFVASELGAEPAPIQRRLLLKALRDVAGMREVALEHVELAADILHGSSTGADLPAARVELRRGKLVLVRKR
jgi:tRNA(Ile)-lysidine synthase